MNFAETYTLNKCFTYVIEKEKKVNINTFANEFCKISNQKSTFQENINDKNFFLFNGQIWYAFLYATL